MCGFIGFICKKNSVNLDEYEKKFNFYLNKQSFRGPDYQEKISIEKDKNKIQLGFNRLSILDLSDNGNQIFKNKRYYLLFNGEILNFKYIKNKYFDNIHFKSNTDTEILFNFLIKFKTSKINELEGMFAFVLIDLEKNEIIMCKDYTGIKPLYYLTNSDGIFFSSDARFLYNLTDKKLDYFACKFFFQFGFTPTGKTLIQNVQKLLPSSYLNFNYNNNQKKLVTYFDLNKQKINSDFNKKNLENKIINSIKKNLISDTKVGVFLSGGLDSSIISIISKKINPEINAYTSFFAPMKKFEKFNKDFFFAEKLCNEYKIKLNKVIIDENDINQKNLILKSFQNLDEPIANLNFFNSFLQSKQAREDNCKVILTGDGADEVFGGYERYQKCLIARKLSMLSFLSPKIKELSSINKNKLPEYFYNFISFRKYNFLFNNDFREKLYNTDDFMFTMPVNAENDEMINYFDMTHWLSNESNLKLDRATMFNSIEARVPFQDISLIKDFFKMPMDKKTDLFNLKKPIKNLNIVPDYIKKRKKHGWFSPESFYLRGYLKEYFLDNMNNGKASNPSIFDNEEVLKMFQNHLNGGYYKNQLIAILSFQSWYNNLSD